MKFTARDWMSALETVDAKGKVFSHKKLKLTQQFYGCDDGKLLAAFHSATTCLGLKDLTGVIAEGNKDFYHGSIPAEKGQSAPWVIFEQTEDRIQHLMECYRESRDQGPDYQRRSEP
jgi:hypothetical protein